MKQNKKLLLVLLTAVLLLTGCTKQLKDADGKQVKVESTNQVLIENILCKPEKLKSEYETAISNLKKNYKKQLKAGDISKKEYKENLNNLLDIDELPECEDISIVEGGYETFWTSVFVKPLAWVIVNIGKLLGKNYAISIIIVTILIKLILFPFTYKSLKQSEQMKKIQPKLQKIEKKYKDKTDQQSMMMKSNEMMALYKENKINPVSGCLMAFIQIPLFFAFYEALYRLPVLFEGNFLGFNMGMTPLTGIGNGNWLYAILPVLVGVVTYFSFKMNKNSTPQEQEKQMNMMFNIMIVMIFVTSLSMSTAIIIYWITNSLFTIVQNLIVKKGSK